MANAGIFTAAGRGVAQRVGVNFMAAHGGMTFAIVWRPTCANDDGLVEASEATKRAQAELKQLIPVADRNGDGKLSKSELTSWLALQDQVASGHVLLTVLDFGPGLFELLDADHDGSLSIPELRRAWERVKEAGCVTAEGRFDGAMLPRHLMLTISRGHPQNPLGIARRDGPAWFRAMDRNGDGYVSRREFTGPPQVFDALDVNKDGFLDPEEASRAANKTNKK